jgi:subtilisin-like proprotein convertase family protein
MKFFRFVLAFCLLGGCAAEQDFISYELYLPSTDSLVGDTPDKATLFDEKTDEILPSKYLELLQYQSPVKNQGRRGSCSLHATAALIEHLYMREGTHTNLDLSEQFLVWIAKQKDPTHKHSVSLNTAFSAANHPGIPQEHLWPYERHPWTEDDDPACIGEEANRPLRCFTNGEPPEAALVGRKYRTPEARWISTTSQSIKAFMFEKQLSVPFSLKTFSQAWNFPSSTLLRNPNYFDKGYILYPNDEDKETSPDSSHAVLLVGWDDEMELPRLDKDGNTIVDDNGEPIVDKGCFLLKNSWGTQNMGRYNSQRSGYAWVSYKYAEEFGHGLVVDNLPDPNPPKEEHCGDGKDDDWDGQTDCDDSECSVRIQCGETPHVFVNDQAVEVPYYWDVEPPFESPLEIPTGIGAIRGLSVSVDVDFPGVGDVTGIEAHLVSPAGVVQELADLEVSTDGYDMEEPLLQATFFVDEFNGQDSAGVWKLRVLVHEGMYTEDDAVLNKWSIGIFSDTTNVTVETNCSDELDDDQDGLFDCDDPDCQNDPACRQDFSVLEYENNSSLEIPDDNPTGISSVIVVIEDVEIQKLELEVDINHSWGGDIELRLVHPDGTDVQVWQNTGEQEPVPRQHVVDQFVGKMSAGRWTLLVIDHAGADIGTLDRWVMTITRGEGSTPNTNPGSTIISEYIEGNGSNKALEIFNLSDEGIQLQDCELRLYYNGSIQATVIGLEGSLAPLATHVLCHSSAQAELLALCDQAVSNLNFNGDDAIELVCNGSVLDVFGTIGQDPGSAWGSGDVTTQDHSLRRKCSIMEGDPDGTDSFDPVTEWDALPVNTFDGLGQHC